MPTEQTTAGPSSPADVIDQFATRLNRGDLEGSLALYLPNAVFQPAPDQSPISGTSEIREALAAFLALRPTITGEIQKVHEAADTALVINRWRLEGTDPAGEPLDMSGTSADVVQRRSDGSWAILIDDPWGGTTLRPTR